MLKHKETHTFDKGGKNYELVAFVYETRDINGTGYRVEWTVRDLDPIISEYEHVHTGEQVRDVHFETWEMETDLFRDLEKARKCTALNLKKIINDFDGKSLAWERKY